MYRVRPCGDGLLGADPNLHVRLPDRLCVTVSNALDLSDSEYVPIAAPVADDRMG